MGMGAWAWGHAHGGMHMGTCTWGHGHGGMHMGACTWGHGHGGMHMGACTWGHAHGGMHMGAWAWGGRMLLDAYARRMHYVSLERSHLPCTREQRLSELEDGDLSEGAGGRAPLCD